MYAFNILCPRSVDHSSIPKMGRDALNLRVYGGKKGTTQENLVTAECWTTE